MDDLDRCIEAIGCRVLGDDTDLDLAGMTALIRAGVDAGIVSADLQEDAVYGSTERAAPDARERERWAAARKSLSAREDAL